jgi:hypothetical protein
MGIRSIFFVTLAIAIASHIQEQQANETKTLNIGEICMLRHRRILGQGRTAGA